MKRALLTTIVFFHLITLYSQNVGINTDGSSPNQLLHIHENGATGKGLKITNSTTGNTATDGFEIIQNGSDVRLMQKENAATRFFSNGTEKMTILGNGNVGIGSNNPGVALDVSGTIQTNASGTYKGNVYRYENLTTYSGGSTITGTMKITLPKTWSSTMMTITVRGYDYSSFGAWEVKIGGYNHTSGWINESAEVTGTAPFNQVRLGHDGSKCVILLGTITTTWKYPKVEVVEMIAGYQNYSSGWSSNWSISTVADETGITVSGNPTITGSGATAGGDISGLFSNLQIKTGVVGTNEIATNGVAAAEIATNAVGNSEMADNAIGSAEVIANSLTAADLATSSVGTAEVADNTLTANDLATNSVGAAEVATGAIRTAEILDGQVFSVDIANGTIATADLSSMGATTTGDVMTWNQGTTTWEITTGGVAPTGAAGGHLTGTYPNPTIANSVVTGTHIAANTITAGDIATNGVGAAEIAAGAVGQSEIATNGVAAAEIAAGAVGASELATNAVTNIDMADNAIGSAEISNGSITGTDIATATITASNLAANSVAASEIAANAVNASELGTLGATIAGQVLTWDGSSWDAAAAGGSGTVTNIATGSGLTGGAITTTGTISVATGGITQTHIATSGVASAEIQDNTVSSTDILNSTITNTDLASGTGGIYKSNGTVASGRTVALSGSLNFDSNTLYLDGSANEVGIGTSSPDAKFNVGESTGANILLTREDGSTNTNDLLGQIKFDNTDGGVSSVDASVMIRAYASEAQSVGDKGGYLTFETKATNVNGGSSATERMRITDAGNVGIGITPTTGYKLHVNGKIKTSAINETSDRRYKKDIVNIENALSKVLSLQGVMYNWRLDEFSELFEDSTLQMGLIAQEVEKIIPEVVDTDGDGYKSVEYSHLVSLLIEAVKEQQKTIEQKDKELNALSEKVEAKADQAQIDELHQELKELKSYIYSQTSK